MSGKRSRSESTELAVVRESEQAMYTIGSNAARTVFDLLKQGLTAVATAERSDMQRFVHDARISEAEKLEQAILLTMESRLCGSATPLSRTAHDSKLTSMLGQVRLLLHQVRPEASVEEIDRMAQETFVELERRARNEYRAEERPRELGYTPEPFCPVETDSVVDVASSPVPAPTETCGAEQAQQAKGTAAKDASDPAEVEDPAEMAQEKTPSTQVTSKPSSERPRPKRETSKRRSSSHRTGRPRHQSSKPWRRRRRAKGKAKPDSLTPQGAVAAVRGAPNAAKVATEHAERQAEAIVEEQSSMVHEAAIAACEC